MGEEREAGAGAGAGAGPRRCTAFEGSERIASGPLDEVAARVKEVADRGERGPVLVFDDVTSHPVEIDLRGSVADVVARIREQEGTASTGAAEGGQEPGAPAPARGPGRPRLGVVAREVTLLPRHWAWLASQPGGASVALRRLVDEARRANEGRDRLRRAEESAYRFMAAMAGNDAGFEEATRALFAGDRARFEALAAAWPPDVRAHARRLAGVAFDARQAPAAP